MYIQVNKWFEAARRQARGSSAEMPNGSRRRGRPPTRDVQKSPMGSFGMTTPNSVINTQKSPPRGVGMMTPNSAMNVQMTLSASVGTSKGSDTSKDFMDSERKKAIMRELRKQKMGR